MKEINLWINVALWITTVNGTADSSEPYKVFEAYDCDEPRNIQDFYYPQGMPHCEESRAVKDIRNVTYHVLQKEEHRYLAGWACTLTRTQDVRQCGAHDHETRLGKASFHDLPVAVSLDSCTEWVRKHQYIDTRGQIHALALNSINIVRYQEVGHTYDTHDGYEVECRGGEFPFEGKVFGNMMVDVELRITIFNSKFQTKGGLIYVTNEDLSLPCEPHTQGCVTTTSTYIWTQGADHCPLAHIRTTSGVEVTNGGKTVFMSNDGSMIRLVEADTLSYCQQQVISTNYPGIFLERPRAGPTPFRKVHSAEVEIHTYINNRDDFLYNHMADQIEKEFQGVLKNNCLQNQEEEKLTFFLRHQNPDMLNYFLGNGMYATPSGEVLYVYQCRPTLVYAVERLECFQALPVRKAVGNSTELLFLEPLTKRLTRTGIPIPCSQHFVAKYRNREGNWVTTTPYVTKAASPRMLPLNQPDAFVIDRNLDWAFGGIYTREQLEDLQQYMEFSREKQALGAQLVQQAAGHQFDQAVGVHQLFPQAFPNMEVTGWLTRMWSFMHTFGETAAVIITLFGACRLLASIMEALYSFVVLRDVHGCGKSLLWIPCSTLFLLRSYHANKRKEKEAETSYLPSSPVETKEQIADVPPTYPNIRNLLLTQNSALPTNDQYRTLFR